MAMTEFYGIPRVYGMIVIIFGLTFFIPLLGFFLVQLDMDSEWSVVMFVLTVFALSASVLMIMFGTNIVWYHDKRFSEKTQEEIANDSDYAPKEGDKSEK